MREHQRSKQRAERLLRLHNSGFELKELEEKAQLTQQVERAREGHFIPLSVTNPNISPKDYFDETHDYTREKIRGLYFGVADPDLRKALIAKARTIDAIRLEMSQADIAEAQDDLARANRRAGSWPFLGGGAVAVLCVAAGFRWLGLPGAIGGAVAGLFLGLAAVQESRSKQLAQHEEAQRNLEDAQEHAGEMAIRPRLFTSAEEETGDRDTWFDDESAVVNRTRPRS